MKNFATTTLFLLVFCFTETQASHIIGGELTCSKTATNLYRFKLHLYRDCTSTVQFTSSENIYIYQTVGFANTTLGTLVSTIALGEISGGTAGTTVSPNYYSPCLTYPIGLCVSEAYYEATVTLPNATGGYTAIHQSCCRNASVINFTINSGGGGGATTGTTNLCQVSGLLGVADSMPVFAHNFPFAACQSMSFDYVYNANDANHDSVAYSIIVPYDGTNTPPSGFTTLTFSSGCNLNNYLFAGSNISIHPTTGRILANPTTLGRYIVGILVSEFRNGVQIGSYNQDVELNVTPCFTTVIDSIPANHGTYSYYPSKTITFPDSTHPVNALTTFAWDFGDLNVTTDTSSQQYPTYTYADSGWYNVSLIVNPGFGGSCTDTAYRLVWVAMQPHALGITSSNNQRNTIHLFPNPATNQLTIVSHQFLVKTIEVHNVLGQIINCKLVFDGSTENCKLNTESLPSGIYFLKATDDNGLQQVAKFVKE